MSRNSQRKACSLHRLLQDSRGWKPLPALQHAQTKLLLHTDLARTLTAFAEAGLSCLMEWDYYERLTKSDPKYARQVRQEARLRGIPESIGK